MSTPNFVIGRSCEALVFNGNDWVIPTEYDAVHGGLVDTYNLEFCDATFAKALFSLKKTDGKVFVSTIENTQNINFTWIEKDNSLLNKNAGIPEIKRKNLFISNYLVIAAFENNSDVLMTAFTMYL